MDKISKARYRQRQGCQMRQQREGPVALNTGECISVKNIMDLLTLKDQCQLGQ